MPDLWSVTTGRISIKCPPAVVPSDILPCNFCGKCGAMEEDTPNPVPQVAATMSASIQVQNHRLFCPLCGKCLNSGNRFCGESRTAVSRPRGVLMKIY